MSIIHATALYLRENPINDILLNVIKTNITEKNGIHIETAVYVSEIELNEIMLMSEIWNNVNDQRNYMKYLIKYVDVETAVKYYIEFSPAIPFDFMTEEQAYKFIDLSNHIPDNCDYCYLIYSEHFNIISDYFTK
jgi:hypothetical protein